MEFSEFCHFRISMVGINYYIPGFYPTWCGAIYQFINIKEENDINDIWLGADLYFVFDNTEDFYYGKKVLDKLKNEKFIMTNIDYEYGAYIQIPKKYSSKTNAVDLDYDYVSKLLIGFIQPLVVPGLICIDICDVMEIASGKKKIRFQVFDGEICSDELDKHSDIYFVVSFGDCGLSLQDVDEIRKSIESKNDGEKFYATMFGVDFVQKPRTYLYEIINRRGKLYENNKSNLSQEKRR